MSQNKSDRENAEHKGPRLHLERAPRTGSQREFDEVVPEFMHRAFYRSTEDEFPVVDSELKSRLSRKSKEPDQATHVSPALEPVTSHLPPPKPLRSPEPSGERESLEPLRQSGSFDTEPEVIVEEPPVVPLRTKAHSPPPPPPGRPPSSASKQSGINFPVVAALLFIIGIFIWREQTRPGIPPEQTLPIPQGSQVVEQVQPEPPALGEESPYPGMSPRVVVPEVSDKSRTEDVAEEVPNNLERAATFAEEAPEDTTTYPSREASAQRAAIMQNMSDRTVTNIERTSREEPASPPSGETSLFPMDQPPAKPVVSTTERPDKINTSEAAATEAAISRSLFPTESDVEAAPPKPTQPVATSKPPVKLPLKPPTKVNPPIQPGQGEPYEIAEPTF